MIVIRRTRTRLWNAVGTRGSTCFGAIVTWCRMMYETEVCSALEVWVIIGRVHLISSSTLDARDWLIFLAVSSSRRSSGNSDKWMKSTQFEKVFAHIY